MRKLLSALAAAGLALALVAPVSAQKVSLGVKGGLNFADLVGNDAEQANATTYLRGIGGLFAVIEVTPAFSLQPEFLYSQKGANWRDEGIDGKVKLNYFEVPLLAKLTLPSRDNKFLPNVFLGPSIGYKSDCKTSGEEDGVSVTMNCDNPEFESAVRTFDFAGVFGIGADVNLGRAAIVLDGRYSYSLRTIDDSNPRDQIKNSVFSAMVGVKLNLAPSRMTLTR